MRRRISAFFGVALAMLLTVALAVPASAADDWWATQNTSKPGGNTAYKYGLDYYKKEWRGTPGAYTFDDVSKLPVSSTVNPSATGPSWYLEQQRNRGLAPGNAPLEGTIVEPGKTLVRAPSTYTSGGINKYAAPIAGGGFLSVLMGSLGLGMGATSTPPKNWAAIAQGQGVPSSCTDNFKTCSPDDMKKVVAINSCGQLGTCDSIGAISGDKMAQGSGIPLLDNLFAALAGQQSADPQITPDGHNVVDPRGCLMEVGFESRPGNNGTLHSRVVKLNPEPPWWQGNDQTYYDNKCIKENLMSTANYPTFFTTTCIDNGTGRITESYNSYSGDLSGTYWNADGTNKVGLCGSAGPTVATLLRIQFMNPRTQAQFDQSPSDWKALIYSEWVNPDPKIDVVEDLKITTSWDCADANGAVVSFSQTVAKTAAFIAPDCPLGSDLVRHDVKATVKDKDARTLDAGSAAPGALAAYPDCQGHGCTMDVWVDGSVCVVARAECVNWPAIQAVTPSRVSCKWGSYAVPTSDCFTLSNGYKTSTGVVFDPRAGTWVGIDGYGNPVAPNPEPWSPTNPNPAPGVSPAPAPAPGSTVGTAPSTPPSTFPTTGTNPATSDGCSAPGWSWNPVEFVKNPVVCALKEAFVPKTDIQARSTALANTAKTVAPISWISKPMIGPSGGGCPNWVVHVANVNKNVVCDSSFTAAIVGARGPMFGLVASAMMWPLMRSLWYALIPIVRVTPSGSK